MKKRNFGLTLSLVLAAGTILGACGSGGNKQKGNEDRRSSLTVAMVTDEGGVDDKSFNQSAWDGLKAFGKENNLKKGKKGYNYFESKSKADYASNLNTAVRQDFDMIYGVGYKLKKPIEKIADHRKDNQFAIIDEVIKDKDNVASIIFKEHEGSFLVGVIAGLMTKSNKVGFIGGVDSELITKFAAGFESGVKKVNPNATVQIEFADTFSDSDKVASIAASQYSSGVDIIYHAAGGAGLGVFTEAKSLKQKDPERDVWVIGADQDQHAEGDVKVDGEIKNVTLISMIKRVDIAVKEVADMAKNDEFPGGELVEYGLKDGGVEISTSTEHLTDEVLKTVKRYEAKIKDGEMDVPSTLNK